MELLLGLIVGAVITWLIIKKLNKSSIEQQKKQQETQPILKNYEPKMLPIESNSAYKSKLLLTANEQDFYNKMKGYVYSQGLHIITKIRLADLIEPKANQYRNRSEWTTNFNKISAKHIDFAIVNNDMKILFLIELDDNTHNYSDRQNRDEFVNKALLDNGYMLLRVYNNNQGVDNIINCLKNNF